MNKQELIEKYEKLEGVWNANGAEIARQCFLRDLKQLNEIDTNTFRYRDVVDRLKELAKIDRVSWIAKIMEDFRQECDMISKKVTVPQFVADWIERSKQEGRNLRNALNNGGEKMRLWFLEQENYDLFARAWLDGYTVEKEKKYIVKVKAVLGQYLGRYYLNNEELTPQFTRTQLTGKNELPTFTRKELEETGFGDVFNSPLFEVEEVG